MICFLLVSLPLDFIVIEKRKVFRGKLVQFERLVNTKIKLAPDETLKMKAKIRVAA